jgi:hypothetical protein
MAAEASFPRVGSDSDEFRMLNLGLISLLALVLAVVLSCFTQLNVGILSIALAWIIGVYLGGMPLKDIVSGFPVDIFLTLTGVTLIFISARERNSGARCARSSTGYRGSRWLRADLLLPARRRDCLLWPGQYRNYRIARTNRNCDGDSNENLAVSYGDHGR